MNKLCNSSMPLFYLRRRSFPIKVNNPLPPFRLAVPQKKFSTEVTDKSTDTSTDVQKSVDKSTDVLKQAPNRDLPWTRSQQTRKDAMVGPRFEQTDLEAQPRPLAAIELIAEEPIHYVEGRTAVCHGGGGALGHPQIYINLDQPGPHACGYCGIRFERKPHHH